MAGILDNPVGASPVLQVDPNAQGFKATGPGILGGSGLQLTAQPGLGGDPLAHELRLVDSAGTPHYRMEVQDVSKSPSTPGLWGVGFVENMSRKFSGLAPQMYQAAAKYVEDRGGTLIGGMNTNRLSDAAHQKLKDVGLAEPFQLGDKQLLRIKSAPDASY